MLNKLKEIFSQNEIIDGQYGIEREALRVKANGQLAQTMHSPAFGDKNKNKYITTDFSESQIELITPTFRSPYELYNFTNILYDTTVSEIKDEYLWPQSMPCIIEDKNNIKVAQYGNDEEGIKFQKYREKLLEKYGVCKQLICGIHYNFSFTDEFLSKLHDTYYNQINFKDFKNDIYLKISRNYIRYRWLIIYLTGASPEIHETFECECKKESGYNCGKKCSEGSLSYRNSECGYRNCIDIYPDYNSVSQYVKSIKQFIKDGVIDSHKELYSSVRLKAVENERFLESLENDGIKYLEYRSIDINPFEKGGIVLKDLEFLQILNIYFLIKKESSYEKWQEEANANAFKTARYGLCNIEILKDGKNILMKEFALSILEEIKELDEYLNLGKADIIDIMMDRVKNPEKTYAKRILNEISKEGYVNFNIKLSENYKNDSYKNRFKLCGYEDLELSTQILMKEALKKGIEVKLLDRKENFIELRQENNIQYVKQATKTSKDNYVSVLVMENKSVTKKVLNENNIRVPLGEEVNSIEDAEKICSKFINKPVVIKPKSTNFGTGISIFKDGTGKENLLEAFMIAFKFDNTVLIEEFIKGKEYRFLVINDKVCGILHRVPANVKGDGERNIKELVCLKNQNPLRGYHYVTPLEKINLDENAELFLKDKGLDFEYIPKKDEVIYLRENSNISTGGDSIDYTDSISERFKDIAVKCAKAVNAKICGVDMMLENFEDENSEYGIIELNFNPAIHIHCYPYKGKERNIAIEILKLLEFNV